MDGNLVWWDHQYFWHYYFYISLVYDWFRDLHSVCHHIFRYIQSFNPVTNMFWHCHIFIHILPIDYFQLSYSICNLLKFSYLYLTHDRCNALSVHFITGFQVQALYQWSAIKVTSYSIIPLKYSGRVNSL